MTLLKWLARYVSPFKPRKPRATRPPDPQKDKAAIRRSLSSKLIAHLIRDAGGND